MDPTTTPLIRNSRSTSDPKTQKCAADRHYKIQQIPMVYEGTPNSSYLIQLPLDQDRRCQLAKRVQHTEHIQQIVTGCLIDTEHISTYFKTNRSTTDPKTQKCAADRHCKIQQIPMVYEGTPNSSYLTQLPLDQDPEMSTGKESSTCITHPANRVRIPYQHRTHLNVLQNKAIDYRS